MYMHIRTYVYAHKEQRILPPNYTEEKVEKVRARHLLCNIKLIRYAMTLSLLI